MLAVLDPWLLHVDAARGLAAPSYETLADLTWMLMGRRAVIPHVGFYWKPFVTEILQPFHRMVSADHRYRSVLDRLVELAQPVRLAQQVGSAELSGFDLMFDPLGPVWAAIMRQIIARCAQVDETIVLTRLVPGRNARVCDHDGRPALVEKLCWELHVPSGGQVRRIPCICSSRNLGLRWTCRYADALPAHEDGATFPFCPPPDPEWADPARAAWRTRQSRPTWADRIGHFWAEPAAQDATGRCYHWDVYLSKTAEDEYGLAQLNIARWRPDAARDGEKPPGALHHVPEEKRHRLRKTAGWSC